MKQSKMILHNREEHGNGALSTAVQPLDEYYKSLYDSLAPVALKETPPKIIAITSCSSGEGVSTVATNLCQMLALSGDGNVLFLEANHLHPSAHSIFEVDQAPGLGEFLWDGISLEEACQETSVPHLSVMTSGNTNRGALQFESSKFPALIEDLKSNFQSVIIDAPALRETHAVTRLIRMVDGIILTIEAERVRREVLIRAKEELQRGQTNILGVVLNKRRFHIPGWIYNAI